MNGYLYWITTAQPIVRFPVFLMGILGGLQVIRAHQDSAAFEDPNLNKNLLHAILPWGWGGPKSRTPNDAVEKYTSTKIWKKKIDFSACFYFGFLTTLVIIKILFVLIFPNPEEYLPDYYKERIIWGAYLQFFSVPVQLTIVIGLCMDAGESKTSRFLRTSVMQFLGRVSFSLYLLHIPTIKLFGHFLLYKKIHNFPSGTPLFIIILAIILSFIVNKYFEEPISRALRCKRSIKMNI